MKKFLYEGKSNISGERVRLLRLTRRRYPKGTNFSKVPARELQDLADWLNHYPRKIFGFHCAATITEASLASL